MVKQRQKYKDIYTRGNRKTRRLQINNKFKIRETMKTFKSCILLFLMWCLLLLSDCLFGQIHIKDNQSFHLAIGNDGVEIETSRNLYIRAGINLEKAIGCVGINVSDSYDDQWVNHFGIRLGKLHGLPAGVFGVEYGVDKKLTEKLFVGGRVYNDWIAKNTGTQSKAGWKL